MRREAEAGEALSIVLIVLKIPPRKAEKKGREDCIFSTPGVAG
jgi:hypothetical protein